MKKLIFIYFLSILLILSCSSETNEDSSSSNNVVYGEAVLQTLSHNAVTREYLIYIPNSYNGNTRLPLMFNFHGYGGRVEYYINDADMRPLAELENFILVYPQGTLLNGNPHWNPSLPSSDNKSSADDLGFIEKLIEKLARDYAIDLTRVYSCGYSSGSFFSYGLACHHSDKIAAIGSVAGTMLGTNCNPSRPVSMINLHGTSDVVVPYNGNQGYSPIPEVLTYWINFNQTDTNAIRSTYNDNGRTIEHYAYLNGSNGTAVQHYKIVGGGHDWFNFNYHNSNTSRLIWDFVSKYNINGLISN